PALPGGSELRDPQDFERRLRGVCGIPVRLAALAARAPIAPRLDRDRRANHRRSTDDSGPGCSKGPGVRLPQVWQPPHPYGAEATGAFRAQAWPADTTDRARALRATGRPLCRDPPDFGHIPPTASATARFDRIREAPRAPRYSGSV